MYLHVILVLNFFYFVKPACVVINNTRPSPIDIQLSDVVVTYRPPLQWHTVKTYKAKDVFNITNSGHTFVLVNNVSECRYLTGGTLGTKYLFEQFSFHWGTNNSVGSEHKINGHQFPMELHARHVQYTNPSLDKYVIVAFFVNITKEDNPYWNPILEAARKVPNTNDTALVYNLTPMPLININFQSYYDYPGSLSIPPYSPNIRWLVVTLPIEISQNQINQLRMDADKDPTLKNNFQCSQLMHNRTVDLVIQDKLLKDF